MTEVKIFDLIRKLGKILDGNSEDYSTEYCNGYRDALSDLKDRLEDMIKIKVEE